MEDFLFDTGQHILNEFKVQETVRTDFFSEHYRVSSIRDSKLLYDLVLFSIEIGSIYEDDFEKFAKFLDKTFKNQFKNLLIPNKLYRDRDSHRNRNMIVLLYEEDQLIETLAQEIQWDETAFKADRLLIDKLKRICSGVLECVEELHSAGSFHSFISPDFIYRIDDSYRLAVPGLGRLTAELQPQNIYSITAGRQDLNVFPLAPEGVKNTGNLKPKSDIWSLGVLMAVLSSGGLPFHFNTEKEYLSQIKHDQFKLNLSGIPRDLQNTISRCLQPDPSNRLDLPQLKKFIADLQAFWICPKCNHKNEAEDQHCQQCSAPFVPLTTKPGQKEKWLTLSYEAKHLHLENPRQNFLIRVGIQPHNMPNRRQIINTGESATLTVISNVLAGLAGTQRIRIDVLPKPIFEFEEEQTFIHQTRDSLLLQGEISFRLVKSKVLIKGIELLINNEDQLVENIQFEKRHREIAGGATVHKIRFNVRPEIEIDKPVKVKIIFNLHNRKPYTHETTITPRFPAELAIKAQLKEDLKVFSGQRAQIDLTIENIGGSVIEIQNISMEPSYNFAQISMPSLTKVGPGDITDATLSLDGTGQEMKGYPTKLKIDYHEFLPTGNIKHLEKFFDAVLHVKDLDPSDTLAVDFGTTNTCAAFYGSGDDGSSARAIVLENLAESDLDPHAIPSIIYYQIKSGLPSIGREAKEAFTDLSPNVFYSLKRHIGEDKRYILIFENKNPITKSCEEMIADYIKELLNNITNTQGKKFENYVFTYPTKFGLRHRRSYEDILKRIGIPINKTTFFDEGSAAALSYAHKMRQDTRVLVYDYGGGTTDIVYARFCSESGGPFGKIGESCWVFRPLKAAGHPRFGGDDVTLEAIQIIREAIYEDYDLIVPYISPLEKKTYKLSESDRHKIGQNGAVLWNLAEFFKINIRAFLNVGESEKKLKEALQHLTTLTLNASKHGQLNEPGSWRLTDGENVAGEELTKLNWQKICHELFTRIYLTLGEIIKGSLQLVQEDAAKGENITILLLGKASQFPLVKSLFEFYIRTEDTEFDREFYGFEPERFDFPHKHLCRLEVPKDLKSIVAKGAMTSIDRNIKVEDKVLLNDVGILSAGDDFASVIHAGKEKVHAQDGLTFILEMIANNTADVNNYAVYVSEDWQLPQQFYQAFLQNSYGNKGMRIGAIDTKLNEEWVGTFGKLIVYVDHKDLVKWAIVSATDGRYLHLIAEGIINA